MVLCDNDSLTLLIHGHDIVRAMSLKSQRVVVTKNQRIIDNVDPHQVILLSQVLSQSTRVPAISHKMRSYFVAFERISNGNSISDHFFLCHKNVPDLGFFEASLSALRSFTDYVNGTTRLHP